MKTYGLLLKNNHKNVVLRVYVDENITFTVNIVSPTKAQWSSSIVQRAAACQIQVVDLSSSSHQGDDALAVPVSSSVVQWRSVRYNTGQLWCQVMAKLGLILSFRYSGLLTFPNDLLHPPQQHNSIAGSGSLCFCQQKKKSS